MSFRSLPSINPGPFVGGCRASLPGGSTVFSRETAYARYTACNGQRLRAKPLNGSSSHAGEPRPEGRFVLMGPRSQMTWRVREPGRHERRCFRPGLGQGRKGRLQLPG